MWSILENVLIFVSIQPVYAFLLEHLIHLHLRWLIHVFLLPFSWFLWICFCQSFFFPFFFVLFSCDLMTNFNVVFGFFLFFVCVSIVDFHFVVTMRFWYSSVYINKIILRCWSFDFKCISIFLHLCSPFSHNCWYWYHICVQIIFYLYCIFAFTGELFRS